MRQPRSPVLPTVSREHLPVQAWSSELWNYFVVESPTIALLDDDEKFERRRKLRVEGHMRTFATEGRSPSDHFLPPTFILVPSSPSGEVVRLFVMGGNQSLPKITPRDRAILE